MRWFRLCSFLVVAGCASVKTFTMSKVEDQLVSASQNSEEISQKMQDDFAQKKNLLESLSKGKGPSYKEAEPDLTGRLKRMQSALEQALAQRKAMTDAKAEIASLAYSHKKISGDQPEYARAEEAVHQFETATASFNSAALDYSRESNGLADAVQVKKLYFNFDVPEFQKKAEKSIAAAQENEKLMEREVSRTQDIANSYSANAEALAPVEQLVAQMKSIAQDHNAKINRMREINQQMNQLAKGQNKIPSTSANWSDVQRGVIDFDKATLSVGELFKEFQTKIERVRDLPRGN